MHRASITTALFLLPSCAGSGLLPRQDATESAEQALEVDPRVEALIQREGSAHVILEIESGVAWTPAPARGAALAVGVLPDWRQESIDDAFDQTSTLLGAQARRSLVTIGSLGFNAGPYPFFAATLTEADLDSLRANSTTVRTIRYYEPLEAIGLSTDAVSPLSSTTSLIGAQDCWEAGLTGTGSVVVVIDYGVDHKLFPDGNGGSRIVDSGRVIGLGKSPTSVDFAFGPGGGHDAPLATGLKSHGTQVAAVVGWETPFAAPYDDRGVAPDVQLVSIRVTDELGKAGVYDIAAALAYVAFDLADRFDIAAVNLSLSREPLSTGYCDLAELPLWAAIQLVVARGIPVITGTGNGSKTQIEVPACLSNTIAVGGSTDADLRWSNSNWASTVDIAAPSHAIRIGQWPHSGKTVHGTSFAAAHVSGCLALLAPCRDGKTFEVLAELLDGSNVSILGKPRVDVWNAAVQLGCVQQKEGGPPQSSTDAD